MEIGYGDVFSIGNDARAIVAKVFQTEPEVIVYAVYLQGDDRAKAKAVIDDFIIFEEGMGKFRYEGITGRRLRSSEYPDLVSRLRGGT